jgi:hypothetical protein
MEGQNAPVERCRLARGGLAHEADEGIARHCGAGREYKTAIADCCAGRYSSAQRDHPTLTLNFATIDKACDD